MNSHPNISGFAYLNQFKEYLCQQSNVNFYKLLRLENDILKQAREVVEHYLTTEKKKIIKEIETKDKKKYTKELIKNVNKYTSNDDSHIDIDETDIELVIDMKSREQYITDAYEILKKYRSFLGTFFHNLRKYIINNKKLNEDFKLLFKQYEKKETPIDYESNNINLFKLFEICEKNTSKFNSVSQIQCVDYWRQYFHSICIRQLEREMSEERFQRFKDKLNLRKAGISIETLTNINNYLAFKLALKKVGEKPRFSKYVTHDVLMKCVKESKKTDLSIYNVLEVVSKYFSDLNSEKRITGKAIIKWINQNKQFYMKFRFLNIPDIFSIIEEEDVEIWFSTLVEFDSRLKRLLSINQ